MKITGADIIVRTIIEQGTTIVFGYPGGQVIDLYDALYDHQDELTHILTAHEQGAAHAADGYARATGKVGVCIATSGPGATNLVTGIATAHLDSIPVVAITGNVPTSLIGRDAFQEVDITGVTMPITKHNYFVTRIEDLADTLRDAFRLAKSGRPGPVLVDIPKDIQQALYDYEPEAPVEREPYDEPDEEAYDKAAAIINASEKPFVFFGGGTVTSEAGNEVIAFANKIDAGMGCSMMGVGAIPTDTPEFYGMSGMHGHYASSMSIHNSDCIIAVGARFSDRATSKTDAYAPKASIIHIDIDSAEFDKNIETDAILRGNVKDVLKKLITKVEEKKHPEWKAERDALKEAEKLHEPETSGFTPRNILNIINEYIKPETPVATDVGQNQMWAAQYLNIKEKRKFISNGGLGAMGFGMGAAIGAAFGTGERSVLITGDGGFGMCLTELATAVTHRVPVVVIVLNNKVLGMVRQMQTLFFDSRYSATDLTERYSDFPKIAEGFGAKGLYATNEEELRSALAEAFNERGPVVINVTIDRNELVLPMIPGGRTFDNIITRLGD